MGIFKLIFGIFIGPITKQTFLNEFLNELFFAKTKSDDIFTKEKKKNVKTKSKQNELKKGFHHIKFDLFTNLYIFCINNFPFTECYFKSNRSSSGYKIQKMYSLGQSQIASFLSVEQMIKNINLSKILTQKKLLTDDLIDEMKYDASKILDLDSSESSEDKDTYEMEEKTKKSSFRKIISTDQEYPNEEEITKQEILE